MADRYSEEQLEHLEQLRQRAIGPVMDFHEKYKAEKTVAGKVMALYTNLSENRIAEKLEEMAMMQDERGELEKAAETMRAAEEKAAAPEEAPAEPGGTPGMVEMQDYVVQYV
jgi:ATP-dependent helicase/DNAse subunit B